MNELFFDQEGRDKLISGIEKISKAVKSTLGPLGKTVILESQNHTRGLTVTKDGVTVAKAINLQDPVENLAVRMVKEAADRTATSAGDGTTTAIVLTEAIVIEGMRMIQENPGINVSELVREINRLADSVIDILSKKSKKVTGRTLKDVATISSNNDKDLGKLVSDIYKLVGKDGIVTVENSQTSNTYYEVTNGIKIDRGHTSRLFINNHKNDECILDDVYILATDLEINSILNIENILKPIIQQNKKLLIIGDCSQNMINTLGMNVVKNNLKICNIKPPQFGYKTKELMSDIALSVGARYFSEATGDDLSLIQMSDLGHAQKVVVSPTQTVIVRDDKTSDEVKIRISELKEARERSHSKSDRDFINDRIASLSGGVGVIYVGGDSDIEQKELYDRIEDAVCAVRSAIEEGILPGGGSALLYLSETILSDDSVAASIIGNAMKAPFKQIVDNAGKMYPSTTGVFGYGWDVKNDSYGDMYKMGVIDPAKVTKNALKNAVSVATTILTTNAIVTLKR
ncbi:MAG: chaperonin GroEL [Methylophilaceae bacterium]